MELVGRSPAITRVQELIRRGAPLEGGALITAEPGAGVDAVARELHLRGRPSSSPYIAVDCAAGNPAGVDRLLFGEPSPIVPTDLEAVAPASCIAAARGGTLFLQNVTELRASAQAQLARSRRDGECGSTAAVATAIRSCHAPPEIDADFTPAQGDSLPGLDPARSSASPRQARQCRLALRCSSPVRVRRRPRSARSALALVARYLAGTLAELRAPSIASWRRLDDVIRRHLLPALQLTVSRNVVRGVLCDARRARARHIASGPPSSRLAHARLPCSGDHVLSLPNQDTRIRSCGVD